MCSCVHEHFSAMRSVMCSSNKREGLLQVSNLFFTVQCCLIGGMCKSVGFLIYCSKLSPSRKYSWHANCVGLHYDSLQQNESLSEGKKPDLAKGCWEPSRHCKREEICVKLKSFDAESLKLKTKHLLLLLLL